MKEMGLSSIRSTAKQDYMKSYEPEKKRNILRQQFQAGLIRIWVSDITCFKLGELYLYICVILDLFSRRVVAYKSVQEEQYPTDHLPRLRPHGNSALPMPESFFTVTEGLSTLLIG